jgi:hypothetical protein
MSRKITAKPAHIPSAWIALDHTPIPEWLPEAQKQTRLEKRMAILESFQPALSDALAAINGRASSFTLTRNDVIRLAVETEARLEKLGVPKALRGGVVVTLTGAGPSANAYKYAAKGTAIELTRNSKGDWIMTKAAAIDVYPRQAAKSVLTVSAEARDRIVQRAMAGITVHDS